MKDFKLLYMFVVFMAMLSCSESETDKHLDGDNIQLCASVNDIYINSRAAVEPYTGSTPSVEKPLNATVWFRKANGNYINNPAEPTYLPVRTNVSFKGTQFEYVYYNSNNLQYPTDNSNVYCIGLYPETGWSTTDNVNVVHQINGTEDLMFAREISGSWSSRFGVQTYEHQLTWIKISVSATSHDVAEDWGDIEQISISSKSNATINLLNGSCTYGGADKYIDTMGEGETADILITTREVSSILCSPDVDYTLRVKTTNNTTPKEVTVKLKLLGNDEQLTELTDLNAAKGKCFVIDLKFKPYNVLECVSALNSWDNQNEDIYLTNSN